jgi:hypothetical protein
VGLLFPGKLPWSCAEGDTIKHAQIIPTDWDVKLIEIETGLSSATQHPERVAH